MNWNDLKVVLAISRSRSLKGASRDLGIDQSTVSRRLAAIEATLGGILFLRTKSGFTVTEWGEAVVAEAQEVESRILKLQDSLQLLSQQPAGVIRIATNYWMVTHILAPNLPSLLKQYPHIQPRLLGDTRGRSLARREVELGLWFEMGVEGSNIAIEIGEISYAVYCRRDLDPAEAAWVSFWDPDASREPDRWLDKRLPVKDQLSTGASDAGAVAAAIKAGVGKGLIPNCLAGEHRDLLCLSPDRRELVRKVYVIVHPDMTENLRIKATLAWLRQVFQTLE